MNDFLENYAGVEGCDDALIMELKYAGIEYHQFETKFGGEVPTGVMGAIVDSGWSFKRAWTYWVCEGPGIPLEDATALHLDYGDVVRVAGHCGCPSPKEWYKGFGCGLYDVDTLEGLKALADTIKGILERNKE